MEPGNPLRLLIPLSAQYSHEDNAVEPTESTSNNEWLYDEPVFAFSHVPPDQTANEADNFYADHNSPLGDWQLGRLEPRPMLPRSTIPLPPVSTDKREPTSSYFELQFPSNALTRSPDDLLQEPDDTGLLLFSTPGPCSTVSFSAPHASSSSTSDLTLLDQIVIEARSPSSLPGPLALPPINQTATSVASTLVLASAHAPEPEQEPACISNIFASPRFYEDIATDLSNSDPLTLPVSYDILAPSTSTPNIKNLFTTPGPRFHIALPRPVYFDSPTEDPSDSDPLEPLEGYEINDLDFRWEPFIRDDTIGKGEERSRANPGKNSDLWISSMDFEVQTDAPEPTVHEDGVLPAADLQDAAYIQGDDPDRQEVDLPTITASKITETVFAPTSGIFISPLHNVLDSPEKDIAIRIDGLIAQV